MSEPIVESVTAPSIVEPPTEAFSQLLPPSPIEPPTVEPVPAEGTEISTEKPVAPKLSIDVLQADDSRKPKSPLPPTPATPATPITPATPSKKKKKKGKKGAAPSEPVPAIPETTSEPAPESEPASKSEPVSVSEPISWPFSRPDPASLEVKPVWGNEKAESPIPTPIEPKASKVEPIPEVTVPSPTAEVPIVPETPKEPEPEPTPQVVQDVPSKEEPVSPTKGKKSKQKKKRKSSTAPIHAASPIDDVPPVSEAKVEQPELKVIEVSEPVAVESVVAGPVEAEPVVTEPMIVEPVPVEPIVTEPIAFESAYAEYPVDEPKVDEPKVVETVATEPEFVEFEVTEPIVNEPVVEVARSPVVEELTKNEENRTATPGEDAETPKVVSQELPKPAELAAELVSDPVEIAQLSPLMDTPIEATVASPIEPTPEPILAPLPVESSPKLSPVLETQPEPEVEAIVELAIESSVGVNSGPVIEFVPELPVEPASEPVFGFPTEPVLEAEPVVMSPTDEPVIERIEVVGPSLTITPICTPTPIPGVEDDHSVERVVEPAVSPVEVPKEPPVLETKQTVPSTSKSPKKKSKRKGAAKATVIVEEPTPSLAIEEPVAEITKPEVPSVITVGGDEVIEETVVVSSPTAPRKKKGKKTKDVVSVPTLVEERVPTPPLPLEAPVTLVDTPQLEMEESRPIVTPSIQLLESPIQMEATPKIEIIELPNSQMELTPKIEVIELLDDQYAEATSTISVAQLSHSNLVPSQPAPSTAELDIVEFVPETLSDPEPEPILVDLPQSPVTSIPSIASSPPRSIVLSPRPPSTTSVAHEAFTPLRSVTPSTTKQDEIYEALPMPISPAPSPVRPTFEHIDLAEVIIPLSPSPVSERASQYSHDLDLSGREAAAVPQESQSPKRGRLASSITSIDTSSPSPAEKTTMRPAMPPLITIPVPSPVPTVSPYPNSAAKQPPAQAELESKPNAATNEIPIPIVLSNDLPTNDVPAKSDTATKASSRILDGFSPLRWFGFGGSSSPSIEIKPVEAKPVEVPPMETKSVEAKPIKIMEVEVEPVIAKPVEAVPMEIKPVAVQVIETIATEVKAVETKPVEVKSVKLAEPTIAEINPVAAKPIETPAIVSHNPKVAGERERLPKVTLVPIRKAASPTSPESPAMERTTWSRWPYQPTMVTSIPPVKPRVPLARDSVTAPTRSDEQTASARTPIISTMPPIIPVVSMRTDQPSIKPKTDSPQPRRPPRPDDTVLPIPQTPHHAQSILTNEKSERPVKRPSDPTRVVTPAPNTPSVAFQSPRSSEDSLPAYTPQAPNVDREPKPAPRGILKQRIASPAMPPTTNAPARSPVRSVPQVSRFEFTGSRNIPTYENWSHTQSARGDCLGSTSIPRSHGTAIPVTATTPPSSRDRTSGDSSHRSRPKRSPKESGSVPNKTSQPHTPSPSRETKATSKITTPPKPNLVPVLNDKIIRAKAPKPAKISTARTTSSAYIQPLTSPILLTGENYGARLPENSVYQYDVMAIPMNDGSCLSLFLGISPSESLSPITRKNIFDILQKQVAPQIFPVLARPSFDGKKMLYSNRRLNVSSRQEFSIELAESGQEPQVYVVQLKKIAVITPHAVSSLGLLNA
ncbi:hypothetical protein AG1IA_00863 [Rhizoctonia solani AG-1 IA]|uniref:Protein argonaute N-terminal domain-containing protein n=1 Tax=Thanatephorus cucumeris (strain AG1-IA) TaxID=983506 RepID=L8X468_THACA|nr:hypothetical protein AG1IA_00863 [Rhizoctonia solani AG-1 IA]